MSRFRYWLRLAARSYGVLAPLAVVLLFLTGVYAYKPNEVGPTWGLTALGLFPLTTWLVLAVLRAEPDPQRALRVAATGGWREAWRAQAALVAAFVVVLAITFVVFPIVTGSFDRPVQLGDLAGGSLAHVVCATCGGAFGVLLAPPRVQRAAVPFGAVTVATLLTVALGPSAALASGPGGAGYALSQAPAGRITVTVLGACAVTLALALVSLFAARALEGRAAN